MDLFEDVILPTIQPIVIILEAFIGATQDALNSTQSDYALCGP